MEKCNYGQIIWQKYSEFWLGRTVVRIGFDQTGATQKVKGYPQLPINTVEHDIEHEAMVSLLLQLILMIYPDILPANLKERLLRLALIHDVVENRGGDVSDDGSRDPLAKKEYESVQMQRFLAGLPEEQAAQTLRDFMALDDVKMLSPGENGNAVLTFAQVMFMADKLSAVLSAMCLERAFSAGDLRKKAAAGIPISERDLFYVVLTGSTLITDVWSASFIDCTKWFNHFDIFFNIWKEAYLDVKKVGRLPKWQQELLNNKYKYLYQPIKT